MGVRFREVTMLTFFSESVERGPYESAMIYVPVSTWSDGTPAPK